MRVNLYDFTALENIEYKAIIDFYRAAPEGIKRAIGIDVHNIGPATCLSCRDIEPQIFRRVLGLGVGRPANEATLEEIIAYMRARGQRYAIPVAPQSQPTEVTAWLGEHGFTRDYASMKFHRDCDSAPAVTTELDIRVIGAEMGGDFGQVVVEVFGLPAAVARWFGALAGRPNWICVMAFADGKPAAAGAAYLDGEYAWLGFGGTLESHRRRGAQSALLARRISEAAARGARVAVTETGERLLDRPSNSYRNILRAGFEETYLRPDYLSP